MAYWFYYTTDGQKQGAVSEEQLKELAARGKITPGTMLEHQSGDTTVAKEVKWLTFGETPPFSAAPPVGPTPLVAAMPPINQSVSQSTTKPRGVAKFKENAKQATERLHAIKEWQKKQDAVMLKNTHPNDMWIEFTYNSGRIVFYIVGKESDRCRCFRLKSTPNIIKVRRYAGEYPYDLIDTCGESLAKQVTFQQVSWNKKTGAEKITTKSMISWRLLNCVEFLDASRDATIERAFKSGFDPRIVGFKDGFYGIAQGSFKIGNTAR